MPPTTREHDLLAIADAAHRAYAAGAVVTTDVDDHGNEIVTIATPEGIVYLEKQAIIGGWNIVHLTPEGGYRSSTRGPFAEEPASDEWIDTAWAEVIRIITAAKG